MLFVVPRLGETNAELLEQPLMVVAVFLSAKWIVRRFGAGLSGIENAGVGLIALGILLFAEVWLVLLVQPARPHDPISGAVYFIMLGVFAAMPWLVSRR
jgi:hypothetical protein